MMHVLCREICHHKEAYVRRAVLFAASSVLVSLHPSFVASTLTEGNLEVSKGLEWVRTWALDVAESDTDRECYTVSKELWCSIWEFPCCFIILIVYYYYYYYYYYDCMNSI
jgi:telomere length regulation protein